MSATKFIWGTGRRKSAVARVRVALGSGEIKINGKGFDEYFRRLWDYYLCYCETGFLSGSIDVGIFRLRRP